MFAAESVRRCCQASLDHLKKCRREEDKIRLSYFTTPISQVIAVYPDYTHICPTPMDLPTIQVALHSTQLVWVNKHCRPVHGTVKAIVVICLHVPRALPNNDTPTRA